MAPQHRTVFVAAAALACLACGSAIAQQAGAPAGQLAAYAFRANTVRIIASGLPDGGEEEGFGFIFGQRGNRVYIATADHVVRAGDTAATSIKVEFFQAQGRPVRAELQPLRLPKGEGDLALLEANAPGAFQPVWPTIATVLSLDAGSPAWRIGRDQKWIPPATPGVFGGPSGALMLDFEGLDTPRGASGGPIVGDQGLVGMVVEDTNEGRSTNVLPAETIASIMRARQIPWDIRLPGQATHVSAPPATPPVSNPVSIRPTRVELEHSAFQLLGVVVDAYAVDSATMAARLGPLYAPVVVHNGNFTARAELIAEKRRFAEAYAYRRAQVRPGSAVLDCNVDLGSCRIQATMDWQRGRPGAVQTGWSNLTFAAVFASGTAQIRLEIESLPGRR